MDIIMEMIGKKKSMRMGSTKEGDYVQTVYRAPDDDTPPPIFYRGHTVKVLGGGERINLLCLNTLKWRDYNSGLQICAKTPVVSDEQKFSIIPFLQEEPNYTLMRDDLSVRELQGLTPNIRIPDEIEDFDSKALRNILGNFSCGYTVINTHNSIVKITGD